MTDLQWININQIDIVEHRNPRDIDALTVHAHIEELKWQLQPGWKEEHPATVLVKPNDRYELIHGECRIRALRTLVGMHTIPCIVRTSITPAEILIINLIGNHDQLPLTPVEEAMAYKRLQTTGMTHEQIAKAVGRKRVYVTERLSLLNAAPEIMMALRYGTINKKTALCMTRRGNHDSQRRWLSKMEKSKRAAAQIESVLRRGNNKRRRTTDLVNSAPMTEIPQKPENDGKLQLAPGGQPDINHMCKDQDLHAANQLPSVLDHAFFRAYDLSSNPNTKENAFVFGVVFGYAMQMGWDVESDELLKIFNDINIPSSHWKPYVTWFMFNKRKFAPPSP